MIFSQSWITGVYSSPFPANDCDNIIVTVNGNLSSSNCNYTSVYAISGTIITIDIDISCGGIGLPVITPYTEVVNLGSIPSNNYSLVVNQYSFGSLQETNTSSLIIGTCCSSIVSVNLLDSSNCIGDATSFIDLGTIADSLVWTDNGNIFYPSPSALGWIYMFSTLGTHNITLTAIDSSGCLDTNNFIINVNNLPEISMTSIPATCTTCADGQALATVVSGPFPHQFVWNAGGVSNPLVGLNPGIYSVTFTDGNTCSTIDSVIVGNSVNVNQFEKDDFLLYPNPTNGFINIEYNKEVFKNPNLTIYDLRGNLVKNMILNQNNHPIFTTFLNLRKGFYIIKINEDTKKLIIK